MFTIKSSKSLVSAGILALSLSHMPAAHANGFVAKMKGAFVATGDALKDTAKATGNVIVGSARVTGGVFKESARATEDVLKGTAKAGEAACIATGDVIKGSAKATGAACTATGKAVGTTAGAVADVTGSAISGSAKAVGSTAGATASAIGGVTEGALGLHAKGSTAAAAGTTAALPRTQDLSKTVASQPESMTSFQTPKFKNAEPVPPPRPKAPRLKPVKPESADQAIARLAPSLVKQQPPFEQAAVLPASTEGTRISPPAEESNASPSWNEQEPVGRSAAFAAQYALRTTPLTVSPN